jgi:hypothetical protein
MIWSDNFLNLLQEEAQQYIAAKVPCLYYKFYLPVTEGVSVYTLDSTIVKSIKRITWRGWKLEPVNWNDLTILTPGTVYVNPGTNIETSISRPQWYAMHPTNIHDIRLYPTPDASFDQTPSTDDPYSPYVYEPHCTISCWRLVDTTNPLASLPLYIQRYAVKAYVLWKAFAKEGKGQDTNASKYYKSKLDFILEQFKLINDGTFVSKAYALGDGEDLMDNYRYPKPIYPSQFERNYF